MKIRTFWIISISGNSLKNLDTKFIAGNFLKIRTPNFDSFMKRILNFKLKNPSEKLESVLKQLYVIQHTDYNLAVQDFKNKILEY